MENNQDLFESVIIDKSNRKPSITLNILTDALLEAKIDSSKLTISIRIFLRGIEYDYLFIFHAY